MAVTTDSAVLHVLGPDFASAGKRALSDMELARFAQIVAESQAEIDRHLHRSIVPDAVRDGAVYRLTRYVWWGQMVGDGRGGAGGDWLRPTRGARGPLRASGVQAMLHPFRVRRAGICRTTTTTTTTTTSGGVSPAELRRAIDEAIGNLPAGLTDADLQQALANLPSGGGGGFTLGGRSEWSRSIGKGEQERLFRTTLAVPSGLAFVGARAGKHYGDHLLPLTFWGEIQETASGGGEGATAANSRYLGIGQQGSLIVGRTEDGTMVAGLSHSGVTVNIRVYPVST